MVKVGRPLRAAAVVVGVLFACLGCAGEEEPEAAPPSATASASVTSTPSESPTAEPDSDGDGVSDAFDDYPEDPAASTAATITVVCDAKGGQVEFTIDRVHPDFSEAWSTPLPEKRGSFGGVYCESTASYNEEKLTPVSAVEEAIWAADKRPNLYTLPIPYEQCVEHGTKWATQEWPVSRQQVPEATMALMLCPGHPDAESIRSRIAEQKQVAQELADGRSFFDGNYRVGRRVKAGTYFTENVTNCYWERLDSAGRIIANNFALDALQVEVTVSASDYSFHSEGCGMWRPRGGGQGQ